MSDTPPQLQNLITQYQGAQQQFQMISNQKGQLSLQKREVERSLEELNKVPDDKSVYKSIGAVLVEVSDRDSLKTDLSDQLESLGVRVDTLEKQETHLREKMQNLSRQIQENSGGAPTNS